MLMQGDSDINSVHVYIDSLKEAFKHTMLNQEVIFRNQVRELHRLYMVQIALMKNLGCEEFDNYISWKDNTQPSLMCLTDPVRHGPLLKETRVSSIPMAGSTQSFSQELLGQQGMDCKLQQIPFDLQLPADLYITHADKNFPNKGNVSDHLKDTLESHAGNISDAVDLTLSLSLGEDGRRRKDTKKTWFDKKNLSWPQAVINLEDSTERIYSDEVEHPPSLGCIASITCSEGKHESHVPVLSDPTIPGSVKENVSHDIAQSSSIVDDHQDCQERHSFNQEFKGSQNDTQCDYMSFKKQQKLTSYEARPMDLNKVDLNDSSCYSNDPMMTYPSTASSSGGFIEIVGKDKEDFGPTTVWRKDINDCSNEISDMLQQDDTVNVSLTNSNSKNKRTEIWPSNSKPCGLVETEVSPTGLKSVSMLPMDLCEDHDSCGGDPKSEKDKLVPEIQGVLLNDLNNSCVVPRQVSCKMSQVQDTVYLCSGRNQNSDQDKHADSCMSCCIFNSVLKTSQSAVESGNSSICAFDQFSEIDLQTQDANLSGGQGQRSSDSSELKQECFNEKEESAELDVLVQRAAESLVHISMLSPACSQVCSTRSGSNEIENEEILQPQNSSDSFELIALKLTESSSDDFSVSSKPFEVNDVDKKDYGVKLRRGRRMKDFQKDILPVLASLSRHEICEDINILEAVLRSKEYRKNRAGMADGESWCLPSRSRRTRLNYIRRRNFS